MKHNKADLIVMGAHEQAALADHAPRAMLSQVIGEAEGSGTSPTIPWLVSL